MAEPKFVLQKSSQKPDYWVVTDTRHGIVIVFREHQFNETQKVTILDDEQAQCSPVHLARHMRHIADWLLRKHPEIVG